MQDLSITLLQTEQAWEDKQANFKHFEVVLSKVRHKTDVVVLPEMFHTGFTMNTLHLAEQMSGEGMTWLKQQAVMHQAVFVTSLIISENGNFYNRMVWVEPGGKVYHYDKRKLFGMAGEDQHYTAGQKNTVVEYKGWNILLQVCYDLRFPEQARNKLTSTGQPLYDALIYVANWPERRSSHWRTLLQARAIENQCYVAAVNRVGEDNNGLTYSGDSAIIHPLGEVLTTHANEEQVLSFTLSAKELQETRKKLPFLKDMD